MRTGDSRCPFAGLGLGLDQPPAPIAATLALATGVWSVTFDRQLEPGGLALGNWTFRATGFAFVTDTAVAAGSVVSGTSTQDAIDPGDDVANYAATPADVLGLTGLPAAAFTDFPLVVT